MTLPLVTFTDIPEFQAQADYKVSSRIEKQKS